MPTVNIIERSNLGATIVPGALAANKYDVNVDDESIKIDPVTNALIATGCSDYETITGDYGVTDQSKTVIRIDTSTDTTIKLPDPVDVEKKHFRFLQLNSGSSTDIFAPTPSTISGNSQVTLQEQWETLHIYSDGVNYNILNGSTTAVADDDLMVWAEDNGGLGTANEWSFGNGSEGITALTLMDDYDVIAMSFHAETAGATVSQVELVTHNPTASLGLSVSKPAGQNSAFVEFTAPYTQVSKGDRLGFRTLAGGGAVDARVAVLLRKKKNIVLFNPDPDIKYMAKWFNSDATTNLNIDTTTSYNVNVPIFGTLDAVIGNNCFSIVDAQTIRCTVAGVYNIRFSGHYFAGTRVNVQNRYKKNGVLFGEVSGFYVRNASGNNENTGNLATQIDLAVGDSIQIGSRREAGAGTGRLSTIGTSSIFLEKIL